MVADSYDVVIVGGGVVGSAIAYFLTANTSFHGKVLVVEKDPTYASASTSLSVGGIRQQFSVKENIEMSRFALRFLRRIDEYLRVDSPVDVGLKENGYLFLATQRGLQILQSNHQVQVDAGAEVYLKSPDQLKEIYPWLNTTDIAAGSLGLPGAGWLDPFGLLQAFKKKARALGAKFLADEVVGMKRDGRRVSGVVLESDRTVGCDYVVNASGTRAKNTALMAGIEDLPVHCKKRSVFAFECPCEMSSCPLVIDPSGVYFRPEGKGFICGTSPDVSQDPDCEDFTVDFSLFEEKIWPVLAHRVPAFDRLRRTSAWAGHYAFNLKDQNAILGPHPDISNFYFSNGFSGHGLQQAPAVGLAIAELIVYGKYQTLDLNRLSFNRFVLRELIQELNVV